jgi:8-oxo-dGTP pyrophosphatase MutT (NUDIX family)
MSFFSIPDDKIDLLHHIVRMLHVRTDVQKVFPEDGVNHQTSASVLLLLGPGGDKPGKPAEPCLILNKRSHKVRQPGDLCFPGGSIFPRLDRPLAKLFSLPITSLGRWRFWPQWRRFHPRSARLLALLWATGLRESLEEMRLNPFAVKFLGLLPPQNLVMFRRQIFPLVTWVDRQRRFYPNWEVDKILHVPLVHLLDPANYRRYRLQLKNSADADGPDVTRDFPCFPIQRNGATEILWGATFRIAALFLEYVFDFKPPPLETLPVIEGRLARNYRTGQR